MEKNLQWISMNALFDYKGFRKVLYISEGFEAVFLLKSI